MFRQHDEAGASLIDLSGTEGEFLHAAAVQLHVCSDGGEKNAELQHELRREAKVSPPFRKCTLPAHTESIHPHSAFIKKKAHRTSALEN